MTRYWGAVRRAGMLLVLPLLACGGPDEAFTRPRVLGGIEVDAATLNEGREVYTRTCAACHGDDGDGRGPTAPSLTIPPRDFTTGLFKYGGVPAGELPTDEDLLRTVKRGLAGTPMLAWNLTDRERRAVVQYLKTFSPRWRDEAAPPRIAPTADPWRGREAEALRRGASLFRQGAGCARCHGEDREAMPSEYRAGTEPVRIVPPDLLRDRVRNGTSLDDLYRTIAAGIGGTAMPTWQGSLSEEDLWAVVHYTKSLVDARREER